MARLHSTISSSVSIRLPGLVFLADWIYLRPLRYAFHAGHMLFATMLRLLPPRVFLPGVYLLLGFSNIRRHILPVSHCTPLFTVVLIYRCHCAISSQNPAERLVTSNWDPGNYLWDLAMFTRYNVRCVHPQSLHVDRARRFYPITSELVGVPGDANSNTVVGQEELDARSVNVRNRDDVGTKARSETIPLDEVVQKLVALKQSRSLQNKVV